MKSGGGEVWGLSLALKQWLGWRNERYYSSCMHFSLSPLLFPSWLLSSSLYIRSSADTSLSCLILRDLVHIQARHGPQVLTWQFLVRFSYEFSGSNSSCQGTSTRSGSWSEVLLWQFCPLSIPPCHGTGKLTFKPSLHCLPAFLNAKATDHSWVWNHLFAQAKRKSQAAQITWPVHPSDTPSAGASGPRTPHPCLLSVTYVNETALLSPHGWRPDEYPVHVWLLANAGQVQVQCTGETGTLLCSSPVEDTHGRLVFLSKAPFSIIYFL